MRAEATARLKVQTDYFEHRAGGDALRRVLPAIRTAILRRRRMLTHAAILAVSLAASLASLWLQA